MMTLDEALSEFRPVLIAEFLKGVRARFRQMMAAVPTLPDASTVAGIRERARLVRSMREYLVAHGAVAWTLSEDAVALAASRYADEVISDARSRVDRLIKGLTRVAATCLQGWSVMIKGLRGNSQVIVYINRVMRTLRSGRISWSWTSSVSVNGALTPVAHYLRGGSGRDADGCSAPDCAGHLPDLAVDACFSS